MKVSREQYEAIDKTYIVYEKEENFGYSLLTNERQFYAENYPSIVMEKGNIDEVVMMMVKGKER